MAGTVSLWRDGDGNLICYGAVTTGTAASVRATASANGFEVNVFLEDLVERSERQTRPEYSGWAFFWLP